MIIDSLYATLGFKLDGDAALKRFEAGIAGAQTKMTAFAAAATRIGAVVGAVAVAGVASLGKSVVSTAAEYERFETTLTTLEGSSAKAKQSMNWITKFARETPYEIAGVTEAFIKLRAYGIDPTNGTLRTLGDAASSMDKTLNEAVEMIADASTNSFERMKEFGITASTKGDQVTFSWDRNGKTLSKTVKKNGEDIRKFVLENLGDRFNGAMVRQSKTWDGMIANLGDSWEQFKLKIGNGGFFEALKGRLGNLLDYIGELDDNGTLDRWANNIGDVFEGAVDSAGRFLWGIQKLGEKAAEAFRKLTGGKLDVTSLQALAGIVALLMRRFAPLTFWIGAAYFILDEFLAYMKGDASYIGDFVTKIQELTGASEGLAQAIAAVVAGMGILFLMKPGLLLGGLGKVIGKFLPGAGAGAAGGAGGGWLSSVLGFAGKASPWLAALFTPSSAPKDTNAYMSASPEERERMRAKARADAERHNAERGSITERAANANKRTGGKTEGGKVEGGPFVQMLAALERAQANIARTSDASATASVIEDNSVKTDARDQSSHVSVNVGGVHVQQAVEAPMAAAQAVGAAIAQGAVPPRAQLNSDASF